MMSELLLVSAETVISFSFCSHGIGRLRESRGMGGTGKSLSIAAATRSALATLSGNRMVWRSGSSSCVLRSSTKSLISSYSSGCADTMSVLVAVSARTSTGRAARSDCGRLAYCCVSIEAIAAESAVLI